MSEKQRLHGDTAGLATFWLMAGMGTAMITGHLMLRLMQRMHEAGGAGRMMKGPFGAAGWMFTAKPTGPEVTPPAPAPKPAKAARPAAEDAEVVTPKLRLVEPGETAAAARTVAEAWTKAANEAVETAMAAGEKMVAAPTGAVLEKTEAPVETPVEVVPEAPAALAEILEPETAPVEEPASEDETAPAEEPAEAAVDAADEEGAEPVVPGRPTALAAARGAADDLKRIKGVGPKLEGVLNGLGYFHFDQIAAWGPDELAAVDESLGSFSGRATRGDWIAQAKLLMSGGEEH